MEYHTGDQEQAEEQDLDNKTDDDNPTAGVVGGCFLLSEDGATQGLSEKTEDIACDEEFGEPGAADRGDGFGLGDQDDATERHVHRCRQESGCDERKDELDSIRWECVVWALLYGDGAEGIAYSFDWVLGQLSCFEADGILN